VPDQVLSDGGLSCQRTRTGRVVGARLTRANPGGVVDDICSEDRSEATGRGYHLSGSPARRKPSTQTALASGTRNFAPYASNPAIVIVGSASSNR
jgi:hypothetical protein